MTKQEFRKAIRKHLGDSTYRARLADGWTIQPCKCGKPYCEGWAFTEPRREVMGA